MSSAPSDWPTPSVPANSPPIVFMGVTDFHPWWDHLPDDASRARVGATIAAAYGVGIVGGLLWGGWKGLLAGWAAAAAMKHGIGAVVYLEQPDPGYQKVAALTGGVAAVDLLVASWLARGVSDEKYDEGRSTWSLAH